MPREARWFKVFGQKNAAEDPQFAVLFTAPSLGYTQGMHTLTFALLFLVSTYASAQVTEVQLPEVISPHSMPFVSHTGKGAFDNALALNVPYEQIKDLRKPIETSIGRKLDFLKDWDPKGEAHVTVITPPEFSNTLSKHLLMEEIDGIAEREQIQNTKLLVLGIGSGKKLIDGVNEETFFVLVDSPKLRKIRGKIWRLFVKKGGEANAWDPTWFFPHITIGYTKRDLHEPDVIKNIRSSWDNRFKVVR